MFEFGRCFASLAEMQSRNLCHDAANVLRMVFQERCGEEALMRAVTCERADDRRGAEFWVDVYRDITGAQAAPAREEPA